MRSENRHTGKGKPGLPPCEPGMGIPGETEGCDMGGVFAAGNILAVKHDRRFDSKNESFYDLYESKGKPIARGLICDPYPVYSDGEYLYFMEKAEGQYNIYRAAPRL